MKENDTEVTLPSKDLLDGAGDQLPESSGDEKTSGLGLSGMMKSMHEMSRGAGDFRKSMERRYKDIGSIEQVRALLIDVLCLLHTEFYIRPRE